MWICSNCKTQNEDAFSSCSKCLTLKSEATLGDKIDEFQKSFVHKSNSKKSTDETAYSGIRFCPFSWIQVDKPAGCFSSIFGGKDETVWEPQKCMTNNCQLWDAQNNDCGLVTRRNA